jgi:hypothetical protein
MTKITIDEFLDRIMTNDSSIQEAFTIDDLYSYNVLILSCSMLWQFLNY